MNYRSIFQYPANTESKNDIIEEDNDKFLVIEDDKLLFIEDNKHRYILSKRFQIFPQTLRKIVADICFIIITTYSLYSMNFFILSEV